MTEFFLLLVAAALAPFVIAAVVFAATPGRPSRRITYGVVAGVLSTIAIPLLWIFVAPLLPSHTTHGSVLLWEAPKK